MIKLTLGVLLWSIVHFIPLVATGFKKDLVQRIGEYPFKGIFTLFMVASLYLIISGWKATVPDLMFAPPLWIEVVTAVLVLAGFILFLAPYAANNFKRMFRHPQLVGMICWGVGHLLTTGDDRSLVLFGGLTAWAIIEMLLLNRRDGAWVKPAKVPFKRDVGVVLFGSLAYLTFLFTHHLLFGVAPLG